MYTEIDLLELVKQLRIFRFISSLYLNRTQRELVKFQQEYMLTLVKTRRTLTQSEAVITEPVESDNNEDFDPDANEIDAKLFENIVDLQWL